MAQSRSVQLRHVFLQCALCAVFDGKLNLQQFGKLLARSMKGPYFIPFELVVFSSLHVPCV